MLRRFAKAMEISIGGAERQEDRVIVCGGTNDCQNGSRLSVLAAVVIYG
jgi:hypothetical protein